MRYLALQILLLSLSFSAIGLANMTGNIDDAGVGHIRILADFSGAQGKTVVLNITGPLDSLVVKDRSGLVLDPKTEDQPGYTLIFVTVPVDYLEYDITSEAFTDKNGSDWSFDLVLGSSENVSDFESTLQLPPGATVRSTNGAVEQSGSQLGISWSGTSLDPSKRAHLRAGYDLPPQQAAINPYLIVGAVLLVLAVAFAIYLSSRKAPRTGTGSPPPEPQPPVPEQQPPPPSPLESNPVFKTMDETDKEIIREIHLQGGKTTQAHLYLHTHLPKATLSRRMASLEGKGIILRSQKGNRKLVSLTDVLSR